jgi:hypothetical protein
MSEAAAGERDEIILFLAPAGERRRPLPCPPQLERRLARQHDAAVHDPRRDGRQLACRHRDHRLIEPREPVAQPARLDEELPFRVQRQCEQVLITEAVTDLRRRRDGRDCAVDVALRVVLKRDRNQQVASLGAFPPLRLDHALRAPDPPSGRAELAAYRELHTDPEGAARRLQALLVLRVASERPLENLHPLVLVPEHVRGGRELFELSAGRGADRRQ